MNRLRKGLLVLMLFALSTCGRQVVEFKNEVAPTVTATSPLNAATGIAHNASVTATFSKAMDPAAVTAVTFTLKQGSTPVAGAVTLDAVTNTATFNPAAALTPGLVYTATVTTGAEDMGGLPLADDYVWSFTAITAAPMVTSTSPLDVSTGAALNTSVTATFSKAMDPATITAVTFTLKQGLTPISGAVTLNGVTNTAAFNPTAALVPGLVYTATVTTGAKDTGGLPLVANYIWSFAAATATPMVIFTNPSSAAPGIALDASVTATFSKAMDAATITALTFILKQGSTPISGAVTLNGVTNTATFNPTAALVSGLVYTATVTTGAEDTGGLALAADHVWSFTTAAAAPTVTSTSPLDVATGVALNASVTATFSKAMDAVTITTVTFTLKQGLTPILGAVTLNGATNTATFNPTAALVPGLVYTATITTGARDASGLPLAANYTWNFATATATPTVIFTSPSNAATGIALNASVTATFSKAMNPATITVLTFTLRQGSTPVSGAVTLNGTTNTATFNPTASLSPGLVYTATVTTGAKDSEGLALADDHVWTFTAATAAPIVISTSPPDDATGVSLDASVTATFSKAMDAATITTVTFTLKQGLTPISGTVTLNGATNTATFNPIAALVPGLVYTATVTTGTKDTGGLPLAANYIWSFAAASAAPTVIFTNPSNAATGIALNASVTATFSKAMDPATITTLTFTVKQGSTPVTGALTLNVVTNTATFNPTASLSPGLVYTATITTGAKDTGGLALAADHVWSFTAVTAAPMVTSTTPPDDAPGIALNASVTATFSKAMDAATITILTFTLKQGLTPVAGVVTLNGATNTATFNPTAALVPGMIYTATITTGAKDTGGLALAANYVWTFATVAAAPTVTSTNPPDAATGVALNASVFAAFSKAMNPATITTVTFTLKQGLTPITGAVTLNGVTNTATFNPTAALTPGLVYTATVTTGAKDSGGLPLEADYVWTFTAATAVPMVTSTSPPDDATGIALDASVTATFSKAMDAATITTVTFTLKQGLTPVAGAVTLNGATNTATFNPTAALTPGLVYTATVTTGAKDTGGLPLAANYIWTFATIAAAPTVTSTNPPDAATGVSLNTSVFAAFSKAMDPATITTLTFTLKQGLTPVAGALTWNGVSNHATFDPTAALLPGLVYTATVTTGAKDTGGLPLAANYIWSFTTAAAAPTVTSNSPLDDATGVSLNTSVTATFNKAMDPLTITALTFILKQGLTPIPGAVTLNGVTNTATFNPTNELVAGLVYTATVTTGAKDTGGLPLLANHVWSFATGACSQGLVVLGSASNFVILAGATVTNTGATSITGDLGVSPGTAVTGFPPGTVVGAQHAGDPTSAAAIADLTTAYNDAAGRTLCPVTVAGNLGGQTLAPGLYKSTSSLEISSGDLTLDAQGDGNAVFIFQMASTLTTTSGRQVILSNGAKSANIFWQVGSSATLGSTSAFQGTIMADQSVTLNTGATLNGRALARIGAVTLDSNTVVKPAP